MTNEFLRARSEQELRSSTNFPWIPIPRSRLFPTAKYEAKETRPERMIHHSLARALVQKGCSNITWRAEIVLHCLNIVGHREEVVVNETGAGHVDCRRRCRPCCRTFIWRARVRRKRRCDLLIALRVTSSCSSASDRSSSSVGAASSRTVFLLSWSSHSSSRRRRFVRRVDVGSGRQGHSVHSSRRS